MASFSQNAEKILELLKVQVTPSTERIEVNDVFIKYLLPSVRKVYKRLWRAKLLEGVFTNAYVWE